MLKVCHKKLIAASGCIWFGVGVMLMYIGINLLVGSTQSVPLVNYFHSYFGGVEQTALCIIAFSLFIGTLKGRYVLRKSANRVISRILSFPDPTSVFNMYSRGYYLLLGSMMGLGLLIKFFAIPMDIRGAIDVAIGAALINGSMAYFRFAKSC